MDRATEKAMSSVNQQEREDIKQEYALAQAEKVNPHNAVRKYLRHEAKWHHHRRPLSEAKNTI